MGQFARRRKRGTMGYASASADRPVYRGAPTPRKFPLVFAAIATAIATAVWITHFDPFTSVSDAATPKDTSSFFEDRFSPAAEPTSVGLSPHIFIQSLPADNLDNFLVRQRRRAVEKYREPKAWVPIDDEKRKELVDEIAPLPSEKGFGTEEAKRFDLLMFSLQLALLKGSKRFDTLRKQLLEIASALEEQTGIPAIAQQAVLIEEIQTDQWWEGITVPLLELVRLRLRDLVQHIEKSRKAVVYSNFADEIGDGVEHLLPQVGEADFARFKQKARHFLKAHEDHIVLHKLRQGKPLTPTDLSELEKMLLDAGVGEAGDIERARKTSHGFGRFVRSIVGLDRAAVRDAFGEFLAAGIATATQIEFINMVIEHLTDQGVMDPALLYDPPFTDIAPTGPDQLFDEEKVIRLFSKIEAINASAVA